MAQRIAGIILILFITLLGAQAAANETKPLSESVLRLHVIANSDSIDDQQLKLEVKDAIVKMMQEEFKDLNTLEEVTTAAKENIPQIKQVAKGVITQQGYNYPVAVYVNEFDFPTKSYGNLVFPQGTYQAVRIVIGEGEGKNWWCVLFPPLCLVSSSDKGLSMDSPEEAQVSFKCLELLPKGVKFSDSKE